MERIAEEETNTTVHKKRNESSSQVGSETTIDDDDDYDLMVSYLIIAVNWFSILSLDFELTNIL